MPPPYLCPDCGAGFEGLDGTASHMSLSGECGKPGETWDECRERAELENQNQQTASGSGERPPEDGGDPPADSADGDPSMATPPYRDGDRPTCPECGEPMRRAGSGARFTVETDDGKRAAVTSRNDRVCDGCQILTDEDQTKQYHYVE
jgi:hypothetical protein